MLPLVWKLLFNLSYFGEENDSQKRSVHADCDIVGSWRGSSLISFQLELVTACNYNVAAVMNPDATCFSDCFLMKKNRLLGILKTNFHFE